MMDKKEFQSAYLANLKTSYGKKIEEASLSEKYIVLGNLIRAKAVTNWQPTREVVKQEKLKQMYYFSMEFLLGRMLANNLKNSGIYEEVEAALDELGVSLEELIELERDPGLGNGGLGRLAACFMDSLASLGYAGNGNTIRYKYGLFKQQIINNEQVEVPDQWLNLGNNWEVRKADRAVEVSFYGHINAVYGEDHKLHFEHVDAQKVLAVPYDMPLIGCDRKVTNTLRMWSAEPSENLPVGIDIRKYLAEVDDLCLNVYPDDSGEEGKILRIKQEYFFVAAGLKTIVKDHYKNYGTLDNLHEYVVIQLNDTHPALAIPELLRIMIDEYHYQFAQAYEIAKLCFAYTNHTVMSEALEKWPIEYLKKVLPRIYLIIEEIDRYYMAYCLSKGYDKEFIAHTSIIGNYHVRMANLCVINSFSVNGVAALHSEIIKQDIFKEYAELYPEKFNNKTNGISQRRFLLYSNPQLTALIERYCDCDLRKNFDDIAKLLEHLDNQHLQQEFLNIKYERKVILADFLKKEYDIAMNPNWLVDTIAKRLHAYKRQLLDILYVIYLYLRLKEEDGFTIEPTTFIFSAKAASSYHYAKKIIKLINCVAQTIVEDDKVNKYINVIFIPNYRVTVSEKLMSATDISEQISTAGKEASGTGNMKFMMNGALTLGTLDGANVEIAQLVGDENIVIFGNTVQDLEKLRLNYRAQDYYYRDSRIKKVIDSLIDGTFSAERDDFIDIANEFLVRNDEYFLLADFDAYIKAHEKIYNLYQDKSLWARKCLINIAKSNYFSSDRTIEDYVRDIWKLEKVKL